MKSELIRLHIKGMTCIGCQSTIEKGLKQLEGVKSVKVGYRTGNAEIIYDSDLLSSGEIKAAVCRLGYSVSEDEASGNVKRTILIAVSILALFIILEYFGILNLLVPSQLADSTMGFGMLFVIGLISSVHCIAMCGGINLSQCLPREAEDQISTKKMRDFVPVFLYNLGRVISYTAIGFILGLAGMILSGSANGEIPALFQGIVKIAAGIFMIGAGLNMLELFPLLRRVSVTMPSFFRGSIDNAAVRSKQPLVVGLLTGLMPCGPLQSIQLVALASENPLLGALSMLVFSIGTVPLMFGLGSLVSVLGRTFFHTVTTVGSVLVVVMGLAMLSQGGNLSGLFNFSGILIAAAVVAFVGIASALPYRNTMWKKAGIAASVCIAAAVILSVYCCRVLESEPSSATEIIDGVQVVHSKLEPGDYPDITVQSGIPVKWIIEADEGSINGCNSRMTIGEYGIEYSFKEGENIIEFTPSEAGEFSYSCWMGMIDGTISVVESEYTEE